MQLKQVIVNGSIDYQEAYFIYVHLTHPDLNYNLREINLNWNVDIVYDNKVFNNMKTRLKSYLNEVTNIQNHSVINSKAERTAIRIYETNSSLNHFSNLPLSNFSLMEHINVFHNVILSVFPFLIFVIILNLPFLIFVLLLHCQMN